VHPEDVAASLGMGRGTVYGWLARYREGGREALKARPVPGRQPKLSGEQMRRLYTLIAGTDPRQLEFGFALWTRDMVRTLIGREFRVSLSAVSVGRLLRTWACRRSGPCGGPGRPTPTLCSAGATRTSGDPRAGQGRGRHGVLRRRGRDPLGPPRPSWSNSSLPPPTGDCDLFVLPAYSPQLNPTSGS
jgi:transposase